MLTAIHHILKPARKSIHKTTSPHHPMAEPPWPDFYNLPSSPSITTQDRSGLLDSDTLDVPFWSVLSALLTPPTTSIPAFLDILETIAVELRGTSLPDYVTLKACLLERKTDFLSLWPRIAALALSMPRLFPEHRLPILKEGGVQKLEMSREQVGCLVAHQFLGTLANPVWQEGFQNFDIWYPGEQPHERAPGIYISAVLEYFEKVLGPAGKKKEMVEWKITYELVSRGAEGGRGSADGEGVELGEIDLVPMSEHTGAAEFLGTEGNAVVISANKFVGFGRSATQEEVFVGTTPEACPAVLVTPPLSDDQVLVVRGCEAMVRTVGQGRQIRACGLHDAEVTRVHYERRWRDRTMLFMDALELDSFDGLAYPDIERVNVEREMAKALVAFGSGAYPWVYTGLWGCRTFGGDPGVKMAVLWAAASARGSALKILYEAGREDFASKMQQFVDLARKRDYKVEDVNSLLMKADGSGIDKGRFLDWVLERA